MPLSRLVFAAGLLLASLPAFAQTELYTVRNGQLPYASRTQQSANVVVEGPLDNTREYYQKFMKERYRISFGGGLSGLLGKKNIISAKQTNSLAIADNKVNLYTAFTSLTDSTTEVALFGGYDDKKWFSPDLTPKEFSQLRITLDKYAPAALINSYRYQLKLAQDNVAALEEQKKKLDKSIQNAQDNTAANLKRIEELLAQNRANAAQQHQDSTQLGANAVLRTAAEQLVERRQARLKKVAP